MSKAIIRATALAMSSLAAISTAAHAQDNTTQAAPDAAPQSDADIVVTGTRGALESAEQFKRDSDVLVDGVSADDIGALPDESIADSLTRIPGLTANDNENGFAEVSVRGLGPDLSNTTYNGRILPSTRPDSRRLNLGDLPTEGISRAYVQKTAAASTIEGGLGGTVGLESVHPLETTRRGLSVVGRVMTDDVSQDIKGVYGFKPYGYRGEVSYVGKLADNLGVSFSYAHIQQTNANPSTQLVDYQERVKAVPGQVPSPPGGPKATAGDVDGDGLAEFVPNNVSVNMGATNQRRDSMLAMVQWRPTDSLTASVDGYYIDTSSDSHPIHFIAANVAGVTKAPTTYDVVNSVVTQYQGYTGLYRETVQEGAVDTRQIQGGFNLKYDNGGPFQVAFDASYAQAKVSGETRSATIVSDATNPMQDVNGQVRPFGYDARDPKNITLDFGDQSADDYNLSEIDINNSTLTDTTKAARLDFHYDRPLGFLGSMDFGVRVDNRVKDNNPDGDSYTFGSPATHPDLDGSYLFADTNPLAKAVDYLGGPKAVTFPLFDLDKLLPFANDPRAIFNAQLPMDTTGNSKITEDTMALYYQGNIKAGPLTGNIGVRYLVTDENIEGFATKAGAAGITPLQVKHSYQYFLPALNLRYAISRPLIIRAALSETMSRPLFSAIRIGSAVDYSQIQPGDTINRGNPDLKPYTSKNADLSLEWYPNKAMSFAVQGYYKQVKDFITDGNVETTIALPDGSIIPVTLNTQVNDPTKRHFYGVEIIARRDFDFLPGVLRYFGARVDYSHNWTDARQEFASAPMHTVELTPNNFTASIVNAQLYFSKHNIDAHLAYRYYSPYSRENSNGYQSQPGGTLDLTASTVVYSRIRVIGTIRNLTKSRTYANLIDYRYPDNYGMARNVTYPSRSFTLGLRAAF